MKKGIGISLAVAAGVIVVVAILVAIFGYPAGRALAGAFSGNGAGGGPPWAGFWNNHGWGGGSGFSLPPALQNLASIPAGQRFEHFTGAQVSLKDQNNNPMTINLVPGKVSSVSNASLTITANQGGSQTFQLDSQTIIHGRAASKPAAAGTPSATQPAAPAATQAASAALQNGDDVIVVTLNDSTTAMAVIASGPDGLPWGGHAGWWGR